MSQPFQPEHLLSTWAFTTAAGEPTSTIRVQNLQSTLKIGVDAWGRPRKLQPVLISATVSLRNGFEAAAEGDSVDQSTIHYGVLSKEILAAAKDVAGTDLSNLTLDGLYTYVSRHLYDTTATHARGGGATQPLLAAPKVTFLSIKITLPKASLLGSGVSFCGSELFTKTGDITAHSRVLKLHELRIPTLIGVNANERLVKQIVVTDVEIDQWVESSDYHVQLEQVVVLTVEESSFQTLEALAAHLGRRLVRLYIALLDGKDVQCYPRFNIVLSKPTAVTFADAPTVQLLVDSNPETNKSAQSMWQNRKLAKAPPFPLQGKLEEWVKDNGLDDDS